MPLHEFCALTTDTQRWYDAVYSRYLRTSHRPIGGAVHSVTCLSWAQSVECSVGSSRRISGQGAQTGGAMHSISWRSYPSSLGSWFGGARKGISSVCVKHARCVCRPQQHGVGPAGMPQTQGSRAVAASKTRLTLQTANIRETANQPDGVINCTNLDRSQTICAPNHCRLMRYRRGRQPAAASPVLCWTCSEP